MSRVLPENPSLEHLRKQAKALLRELQQQDPNVQLADAQHRIAREYGFASWPKLKTHLEYRPGATAPRSDSPLAGTWAANLQASRRHSANQFQRATIEIAVLGDRVMVTDTVLDESGREESNAHVIQADGKAHVSPARPDYTLVATWRGPRVLETVATRNGEVVGQGRYVVSPDGATLTIEDGSEGFSIVLDRIT